MTQGRLVHITLPKCGSQWVRDVLTAPELLPHGAAPYSGVTVDLQHRPMPRLPANTFNGPIYSMDRWEWQAWKGSGDKAIVVIRDPRDRLISEIYSFAYSHESSPVIDVRRKQLLGMTSLRDWVTYGIDRNTAYVRFYLSWSSYQDNSVLLVRYEDLIDDQYSAFSRVVEWLGWDVPANTLGDVVDRLSFENRSGRKSGDTDIFSHYRRGVSGDWRNHFDRRHGELWEYGFSGLLEAIGYESDSDWWKQLPGPEELYSSASSQQLPDETMVLRKRIEVLEQDYKEKEAEIQRQAAMIRKQAAVIRRHHVLAKSMPGVNIYRFLRRHVAAAVRPPLGKLEHHPPREMRRLPELSTKIGALAAPSISMVTPSFNQSQYVERTLRSVLEQNYPNLEYWVQDGGSKDRTTEVLECWQERLSGWESEPDRGQSDALNRAFARTSGEIMAWLNADDLLLPGSLDCVAQYFSHHPEVDVVYGDRLLIDEDGEEIGCWILPRHNDAVLSWVDFVPQETLFWRRRIWEQAGARIDESFRFAMDWDLLIRFRDAGARFAHINRFLGAFRVHERQKTSAKINDIGHPEMDRIRKRCLGRVPKQTEIRRAITPYLARHVTKHFLHRIVGR